MTLAQIARRFSFVARSLVVAGIAVGALVQAPATPAEAANVVDLRVAMNVYPATSFSPGQSMHFLTHVTHKGTTTSGGRVEIYVPKRFTNVRVTEAAGFSCGVGAGSFMDAPVWKVTCTRGIIGPFGTGTGAHTISVAANAPTQRGSYPIIASLTPIGGQEWEQSDNSTSVVREVR